MAHRIPIQTHLPRDIVAQIRAAATQAHMSMSEWIRLCVIDACKQAGLTGDSDPAADRLVRDMTFATVALDALLAGHPDPDLRARTHKAFARKLARVSAGSALNEGGEDEA